LQYFLEYAAQFLGNCGNYKGFGDSKFIPRLTPSALEALSSATSETKAAFEKASTTGGGIYETSAPGLMHLGYPEHGHMTTYYPESPTITKEEINLIGDFLEKKKLLLENTRLKKLADGNFELLIASSQKSPAGNDRDVGDVDGWDLDGKLQGKRLQLVFGDHAEEMAKIAEHMKQAGVNADNETQEKMHAEYVKSFTTGSIEVYKQSQRYWIQDIGPMVESDIGFVETYRDPHGVRGEWEGFVAMV
jgi:dipeptidyl-peptidase-3